MVTLNQNLFHEDGSLATTVTHIYSGNGHFERGGLYQGWHIQLGTNDTAEHYTEVTSESETHDVPASLPDIVIPDPVEPEEDEATDEDYEDALRELGVEV